MQRREILRALAWAPAALGLGAFGCGSTTAGAPPSNGIDSRGAGADSSASPGEATGPTPAADWASGGTSAMTMADSYPDPFATPATSCLLVATATKGPCIEEQDHVRQDISEGYAGLPVRLALQVVDGSCNPVRAAKVKVWHTQISGSYSGNTPNNGMCLKDAADATKHYFRGVQTTDDGGRVDFDTCFPGWYRGRAIHIHFTVSLEGREFTSQLVFDQALVDEIFTGRTEYQRHGLPDTTNARDNVVGRGDLASYTLTTARMPDGAMLASKRLVVSLG